MPVDSAASAYDSGRNDAARQPRRQLITARSTGTRPAPRVVLHLPDLNALQGLVLGPPQSTVRRIDLAHHQSDAHDRTAKPHFSTAKHASDENSGNDATAGPWLKILRLPFSKLAGDAGATGGLGRLGRLLVYMQQPKMILAAITAVGLQFAVVLAMLTGNGDNSADKTAGGKAEPSGARLDGSQVADGLRMPAGVVPSPAGPPLVAGPPSLPPPQTLAGADPNDVPPWQTSTTPTPAVRDANVVGPSLTLPSLGTSRPQSVGLTTTGGATIGVAGNPSAAPVKARLMGTIRKSPTRENTP